MNSLTMLGQLEAFFAVSQQYKDCSTGGRERIEESRRLRESILQYVLENCPVESSDVCRELAISESNARDHLAKLTEQNLIKRLSTRPISWTRREG
jgi:hypothetical protein